MPTISSSLNLIHHVEASPRLSLCFQDLGLEAMTSTNQKKFFQVLSRGLRLHATHEPNAADWSSAVAKLAAGGLQEKVGQPFEEKRFSAMAQTILNQPASFLSPQQQDDCLAYASKITLAICLKLIHVDPKTTCHWIKQLFNSRNEDWAKVRLQLYLDQQLNVEQENLKNVVRDFIKQKQRFGEISTPSLFTFFNKAETTKLPGQDLPSNAQPEKADIPKKAKKQKPPDDVSPDLNLFEAQIFRALHPDVSDGYRLPNNWNRLSHTELHKAVQHLRAQLSQSGEAKRAIRTHAACRFISLLAGLSLKTCLTLPVGWGHRGCKGTMHLDLKYGILRRDAFCVAARKKRTGKLRTNGRWWRVQIPPEVLFILVEEFKRTPNAQTLGQLIQAAGLNHESCQHLLNDEFTTSHKPEDARFAISFRTCLLELGVHPALVARSSGDISTTPFSDHFYLTFSEHQVHSAIKAFCDWAGLTAPTLPSKNRTIGSPKALDLRGFRGIVQHLNQTVIREKNKVTARSTIETVVDFHNIYTKAFVLQLILAHGGRGNLVGRMTFARVFGSAHYIAFSDRRIDPYSRQRILPLTQLMAENNGRYLEHLTAFSKRIARHSVTESEVLKGTSNGQQLHSSPFFLYQKNDQGWGRRTVNRNDLVNLLVELGQTVSMHFDHESLNIGRHFWQTELVNQQVAQLGIESFLGHHTNGSEVFGFASGISVREVSDYLRPTIEKVQKEIGFEPLTGLGRTAKRYLQLPTPKPQKNLRALPSKLLLQKLAHIDLVIPDVTIRVQDPPSTGKTLVTHSTLSDLRGHYLQSPLVSNHTLGSVLFCMVSFELVLSAAEQSALLEAALGEGLWRVGGMCIVEAEHNSRPIAQRVLQEPTLAALSKFLHETLRQNHPAEIYQQAIEDLHKLLTALVPSWPCHKAAESLKLLSLMTSHRNVSMTLLHLAS